jgi:hypothetical protein
MLLTFGCAAVILVLWMAIVGANVVPEKVVPLVWVGVVLFVLGNDFFLFVGGMRVAFVR